MINVYKLETMKKNDIITELRESIIDAFCTVMSDKCCSHEEENNVKCILAKVLEVWDEYVSDE